MNAPSEDIKDMLVANSDLGLVFGTNLFIGFEPAKPDSCVTLFDVPGFSPELVLSGQSTYEYPSLSVRVSSKDQKVGYALAQKIKDALHGVGPETWNSTLYTVIYCTSGPALLDRDENGRFRFIINFNTQRR